jgi:hypothetical protein
MLFVRVPVVLGLLVIVGIVTASPAAEALAEPATCCPCIVTRDEAAMEARTLNKRPCAVACCYGGGGR